MADIFLEQSKIIANNFIQNIVFIDDKAYKSDSTNNSFDTSSISKIFAKADKICAIYAPESVSDITCYDKILRKADVVILDWRLDIRCNDDDIDSEADAEYDEPRGEFTLKLISNLVSQKGMLKLIIIYTGETNLFDITDNIYSKIEKYGEFCKTECTIQSANVKILVRAKSQNSDNQFAYVPELKDKIVDIEQLPTLILDEFTNMTNGLLSNFALAAISAIRNNTSRILSVFSPKLDPAYLGHKINLPDSNDAKKFIIQLFGDAITELLENENIDTRKWVENWIHYRIENKTLSIAGKDLSINKEILCKIVDSEALDLNTKIYECTKKNIGKKASKFASHLFQYGGINIDESNIEFAKLTHHKNVFLPKKNKPLLTLGTIIRCIANNNYYICIQQRCDSVRINGDRRFLFLPLDPDEEHYSIIINKNLKFKINPKAYAIKTIKFKVADNEQAIYATKNPEGKYIFTSIYPDKYEWVIDLKEMHAQRILNNYCAELSRVGLNESEWLRLMSK